VQVPADLDLSVPVRQGFEEHGAGRLTGGSLHHRPGAEARIISLPLLHSLQQRGRFSAMEHRSSADPTSDFIAPVHVKEPVDLVRPPATQDNSLGLSDRLTHQGFSVFRTCKLPQSRELADLQLLP
jgi:hypothetical protein